MALKRKKIYESQIEKLCAARMTIDTQILAIENATTNYAALDAMKTGANALKAISQRIYPHQSFSFLFSFLVE
jgi:charged multivesicular body protein 4